MHSKQNVFPAHIWEQYWNKIKSMKGQCIILISSPPKTMEATLYVGHLIQDNSSELQNWT